MELTFNKVDNWYEAEFEITDDINLHIELNVAAPIKLYQKTSEDKYDLVQAFKPSIDKVLDTDLMALVYPKWIKVVSEAEVVRAIVLPEGVAEQVGGKRMITFNCDYWPFQAEEGMTWEQFIESEYNNGDFSIEYGGPRYMHMEFFLQGASTAQLTDVIVDGGEYNIRPM